MLDQALSWAVVFLPLAVSIVFIFIPARREDESQHMKWRISLVIFGILFGGLSWWQQSRANKAANVDRQEARQGQIDLQSIQTDNANQLKNILARLDEIPKQSDSPIEQKQAAMELKRAIQGPRFLTDAQQQVFTDTLKAANGSIVRIITVGTSSESQLLSGQITRAFSVSGWNVQGLAWGIGATAIAGGASTITTSPVHVSCYIPKKDHAVEIAEQALKNAKIDCAIIEGEPPYSGPVSWTSQMPNPALYIVIGPKA